MSPEFAPTCPKRGAATTISCKPVPTSFVRDCCPRRVLAACMVAVILVHPVNAQIATTHAPTAVGPANGTLVLDGGPEATPAVARRFIELAGGDKARIVLIPSAAGDEVARD